jgi:hypothetical protein
MAPQPFQVLAGQNYEGSKVQGVKEIFAKKIVTCGGIGAAGNVPTLALTTNAGSSATFTSQAGYDMAGSAVFTAGTTATVAGTMATVTFGDALSATPVAVLVTAANTTAGATTNLTVGALNVSKTGFSIYSAGSALTSDTYLINWLVMRDPH